MSWVRYDDGFDSNPKVTAVIADNPAAIALHLLARTWTARQPRRGYVPAHQPGVLVLDKPLGADWAAVLTRHSMWHDLAALACKVCRDAIKAWPKNLIGWVIHEWWKYDPPARERSTPGTPSELSAVRSAAGRNGGLASAANRRSSKSASKRSNGYPVLLDGLLEGSEDLLDFASDQPPSNMASDLGVEANSASKNSNLLFAGASPVPVVDTSKDVSTLGASTSEAPPTPKSPRGTRIPDDFAVTPDMVAWARTNCPGVDGRSETEQFILYWQTKTGKDATKTDWVKTWYRWMLNARDRYGPSSNGHRSTTDERVAGHIESGKRVQAMLEAEGIIL